MPIFCPIIGLNIAYTPFPAQSVTLYSRKELINLGEKGEIFFTFYSLTLEPAEGKWSSH